TGLDQFEAYGLFRGADVIQEMDGVGPLGGFLEIAAEQSEDVETVPILRAWACAGGVILADTLESLTTELTDGLKAALPLDAVFLSLHGAASAEQDDDVEGFVLARVREVVGDEIPIVVPLDHHANVTERMIDLASVIVAHETQPHDTIATGRKAARILFAMLRGEVSPVTSLRRIPMITPQDQYLTSQGPMQEWFDRARAFEQQQDVLSVSPCPMQPWLDVAEGGWSVIVSTNANRQLADQIANDMAAHAWQNRRRFWKSERVAPADAVRQALGEAEGLIILSDTGDSVYGGAPGDSTCVLRAILENTPTDCTDVFLVPMLDPVALEAAIQAGLGGEFHSSVGARLDNVFNQPVEVIGRVASISPGHHAVMGERGGCELGRTAMIESGAVRLVLLEERSFAINCPVLYEHHGLDVSEARAVVVKTASNFQFFAEWRRGLIRVDSPGMTQSDLTAFDWKHIPRPMWPLDDMAD
ncbi:MAG: M81 family metallopeptidase, partial [Planctomycetota bacterium]|nr:M81 family metallopeptidase [Planctomycetota bacterium]